MLADIVYKVTIVTGHEMGGSTAADVYIELFGELGSSGKRYLRKVMEREEIETDLENPFASDDSSAMFSMGSVSCKNNLFFLFFELNSNLFSGRRVPTGSCLLGQTEPDQTRPRGHGGDRLLVCGPRVCQGAQGLHPQLLVSLQSLARFRHR